MNAHSIDLWAIEVNKIDKIIMAKKKNKSISAAACPKLPRNLLCSLIQRSARFHSRERPTEESTRAKDLN